MKYHRSFKLENRLDFPDVVKGIAMVKKNKLAIFTEKSVYIYKGNGKPEKVKPKKIK